MIGQNGNNKPNEAEGLAFPLSGNEKLIEEAAKAMAEGEHNVLGWRGHSEDEREWYRKDAAIALAVFEKAHTPKERWASGVEPSDAYVLAALNRYYVPDGKPAQSLFEWSEGAVRSMRAILRGDFEDEEEQ